MRHLVVISNRALKKTYAPGEVSLQHHCEAYNAVSPGAAVQKIIRDRSAPMVVQQLRALADTTERDERAALHLRAYFPVEWRRCNANCLAAMLKSVLVSLIDDSVPAENPRTQSGGTRISPGFAPLLQLNSQRPPNIRDTTTKAIPRHGQAN
jgi:hypothetical protein